MGSQPAARDLKLFADLVQRCLVSVPTRLTVPFSSTRYWSCFHFHNQVTSDPPLSPRSTTQHWNGWAPLSPSVSYLTMLEDGTV